MDKTKKDGYCNYCKSCNKEYRLSRRDHYVNLCLKWRQDNQDKVKETNAQYRKDNPDRVKAMQKAWRKQNPSKCRALNRKYEQRKAKACPTWLTPEQLSEIQQYYWLAKDLQSVTGEVYHVDHIVPLKGKNVCGLHVPWNLQVLPADINMSKGNSFGR